MSDPVIIGHHLPMRAPMAAHGVSLSATATTPTVPEAIVTMCA